MTTPEDESGGKEVVDEADRPDNGIRAGKPMNSALKVLLIIILGIPLGLVALAALVLGVCLLSR